MTNLKKFLYKKKINRPYIIAEIGSNFNQSLMKAKELIKVASDCNANAVKFQLFKSEELYPDKKGLYKIFKEIELNPEWISKLKSYSKRLGLDFIVSPFDMKSVDILEKANLDIYKIASSETTNLSLLRYIAKKNKPIIISTGMCDMIDIEEAIEVVKNQGNLQLSLLQCGSVYPLPIKYTNLKVISSLSKRFNVPIGLSDHTLNNIAGITAVGLGACIFEKHITLNKSDLGPDHFYAQEPHEFKNYVRDINDAYKCLGSSKKVMLEEEKRIGRREGLYAAKNLTKGSLLKEKDLIIKRPALGIRSRFYNSVLGSKVRKNIKKNEPINWNNLYE